MCCIELSSLTVFALIAPVGSRGDREAEARIGVPAEDRASELSSAARCFSSSSIFSWIFNCFSAAFAVRSFFELPLTGARPPVPIMSVLRMNPTWSPLRSGHQTAADRARTVNRIGTSTYQGMDRKCH